MIDLVLMFCLAALTLSMMCGLFRLARGPTVLDRIMAFDLIATCAVGKVVLLSILWNTPVYIELVLVFSLLGFFGAVAFVYHLSRSSSPELPGPAGSPHEEDRKTTHEL
jgi:multicomponent Na+:H+ antiporter subunit F